MNNLKNIRTKHQDISSFSSAYFSYVGEILKKLNPDDINDFMDALEEARLNGNTIFIVGNGGSAATASHICVDFASAVFKGSASDSPFRALSLTDHTPYITMVGNDFGYEHIFTKQLEVQYREEDILIVISASGNSPNVVHSARFVRERGGKVLGLLGFDGGKLKDLCDVCIVVNVPKGEYGPVEDIHMILDHMFTSWMHARFANK